MFSLTPFPRSGARRQETLIVFEGHTSAVLGLSVSLDGKKLISMSKDQTARVWDLPDTLEGNQLRRVLAPRQSSGMSSRLSKSASVSRFIHTIKEDEAGNEDYQKDLTSSHRIDATLENYVQENMTVWSVAIDPDNTKFCVGGGDLKNGFLHVYSLREPERDSLRPKKLRELKEEGHHEEVRAIVFSRDGKRVFSGSHDKTIKIWNSSEKDANKWTLRRTLVGHLNFVQVRPS